MPQHIEESLEVAVPIRTAYDQWTQFEDFPKFMEGVKSVTQLDDKRLAWRAEIAGKEAPRSRSRSPTSASAGAARPARRTRAA